MIMQCRNHNPSKIVPDNIYYCPYCGAAVSLSVSLQGVVPRHVSRWIAMLVMLTLPIGGWYLSEQYFDEASRQPSMERKQNVAGTETQEPEENVWKDAQVEKENQQTAPRMFDKRSADSTLEKLARWGWIGISLSPIGQEQAKVHGLQNTNGALVASVFDGGPAAQAGLRAGDVILSINGHQVQSMEEVPPTISNTRPGSTVSLEIFRRKQREKLEIKLGGLYQYQSLGIYAHATRTTKDHFAIILLVKLAEDQETALKNIRLEDTTTGLHHPLKQAHRLLEAGARGAFTRVAEPPLLPGPAMLTPSAKLAFSLSSEKEAKTDWALREGSIAEISYRLPKGAFVWLDLVFEVPSGAKDLHLVLADTLSLPLPTLSSSLVLPPQEMRVNPVELIKPIEILKPVEPIAIEPIRFNPPIIHNWIPSAPVTRFPSPGVEGSRYAGEQRGSQRSRQEEFEEMGESFQEGTFMDSPQ